MANQWDGQIVLDNGGKGFAYFSTDASGNMALVGQDINLYPAPVSAGLMRIVAVGDSMTASAGSNTTITSLSRSANVVTAIVAGHGRGTGEVCRICNCADESFNSNEVSVTRVDANTITYPSIGPDASTVDYNADRVMTLQSTAWCADNSPLFWLQSWTGGALKLVRLAGNNGDTSSGMLARWKADIDSAPPHDCCLIQTGYNDFVKAGLTAEQVMTNVAEMIRRSTGKLIIVESAMPWTTGGTTANRAQAIRYNRLLRNYIAGLPSVRFADSAKYMVDPVAATKFSPLAGMLQADGIHPSPKAAYLRAKAIYEAALYDWPKVSRYVSCSGDNYGADANNINILDAAPWTTSGGALAGGATGTVAAGIAVTNTGGGTVVASVVSRSDGVGYDQQAIFMPSANNDSVTISGAGYISGRTADGNKLNYIGQLDLSGMSGANIKSIDVYLTYAGANSYHYIAKGQAANASAYPNGNMTLNLASLIDSVICSGHTGVGWTVVIKAGAAGTALTAKLGLQSIDKVS